MTETKIQRDTSGGCSVCGDLPAVNVDGTYWLCGPCVSDRIAKQTIQHTWTKTTHDVYRHIYDQHKEQFQVFASFTKHDSEGKQMVEQLTEWGFHDSTHPLIKSTLSETHGWEYWILVQAHEIT